VVEEFKFGLTAQNMKAIGETTWQMEKVDSSTLMEMFM